MSEFLTLHDTLDTRELPDGRFQLLRALWYQSDLLGARVVKVPEGFVYDKESVPWWLPILYIWLAVKAKASRAGTVHDWIYRVHQVEDLPVPRPLADHVYWEAAAFDGNNRLTRWMKWAGVRIGGASAYARGPQRFQVNGNDRRQRIRALSVMLMTALLLGLVAGSHADEGRIYHRVLVKDIPTTSWTHVCTTGLVALVKKEADGDVHIRVENGDGSGAFIVAEIIPTLVPRDKIAIHRPKVGDWIEVCGITREDKKHGWFEIHPVERLR